MIQMNRFKLYLAVAVCSVFTSCFKDEPLNAECDIEQVYVHLSDPSSVFFNAGDTLLTVSSDVQRIVFRKKDNADVSRLALWFRLTEGATITPTNGSVQDFSDDREVTYRVTSQDGQWHRDYQVCFRTYDPVSRFDFEHFRLVNGNNGGQYYVWSDLYPDGTEVANWATGNPGFNISCGSALPEEYPTSTLDAGYEGHGVKLTTRSTGPLGAMVGRRIAAGNLFLGYFDVSKALTNTLKATHFGLPFSRKPLRLTGWYKYTPGDNYQDANGKTVAAKVDKASVYAVFYRNKDKDGHDVMLYGDDVMTNDYIVAVARMAEVSPATEWTHFDIPFVYSQEIDADALNSLGYNLAVVFSSSEDGDLFCGAIGSTLCIDEVNVEWEEVEP